MSIHVLVLVAGASAVAGQAPTALDVAARAALSETAGTRKLPGRKQRVNVIRDTWGVAHIYAQNQHDLFFAQGFTTAQDRLFQMELWKRGRSSAPSRRGIDARAHSG